MVGKQILNYKVESLLGEGGMGGVYLAVHTQLGRRVAIKALNPSLVKNPGIRARFKNEASTLSELHHPNIVILYDYLEEAEALYLIMEYVEGRTLEEYIERVSGPIPEVKAIPLFTQVLDGFAYAHEQGVVHRDVKPANIMITAREKIKILDFGIAKLLSQKSHTLTQTGVKMGTVLYMSPEQVKGEPVDKRSDVYSLGVTLFQMLTGRSPYDDPHATEFAVYNKIVNEPLPLAKSYYPLVSDKMQAIINKATAKNPAGRFADCQEFKDAFTGNTSLPFSLPATSIKPPTASSTFQTTQTANRTISNIPAADTHKATGQAPKRKGNSWLIGLILALSLIAGVWYLSSDKADNTPANNDRAESRKTPRQEQKEQQQTGDDTQEEPAGKAEPQIIAPEEIIRPEDRANNRLAPTVNLICEISESSTGNEDEIKVLIVLNNTSSEVSYDNVAINIAFYDESDAKVGNYIYDHGHLEAGAEERFLITREVQATRVECSISSAQAIQDTGVENSDSTF